MSDDISARPDLARSGQAVREDEAVRAAVFEAVSDGIVLLEGLRIVDCNARACSIYERSRDDLLGRSPMDFSPATQPAGGDSWLLAQEKMAAAPCAHPLTLQRTGLIASVGGPLLYREELIGAITLGHEAVEGFTDADAELLRLFATHAAVAIQNARLFQAARDCRA